MRRLLSLIMVLLMLGTCTITSKANDITRIDSSTFRNGYEITTLHIGSDVDEVTSNAFRSLVNLREITVSSNNPFYTDYSGCLYDKYMTELVCYPPALQGAIIPSTVVSIAPGALYGVPQQIKVQIKDIVEDQASSNLSEDEVPGEHFIHTENGVKWKGSNGLVKAPDTLVMMLAANVVDASSNSMMTQPQQLEAAFNLLSNSIVYERSMEVPTGNWTDQYAVNAMSTNKGNCYGYAAAFAYIAKGLGYDARVCTGTVTSALGGRTPHAWTEVKIGKKWYVFDAEMQRAKGSGYYKVDYDSYPAKPLQKETSAEVSF